MSDYKIAMLWMRGPLSFVEQLCIQSFLDIGHHVILYSYGELTGVPPGVELRDAAEVLPETDDLTHARTRSPAPFSDRFRYVLLSQTDDLIWADTDAYCVRRFEPVEGHLYAWESDTSVAIGALALPRDSKTLAGLRAFTADPGAIPPWESEERRQKLEAAAARGEQISATDMTWGIWGPKAFTWFLRETGEIKHAMPIETLYPIAYGERRKLFLPGSKTDHLITDQTMSIHFFGRRMRRRVAKVDRGLPHPESLLGRLLLKHGIDPCEAPLRDWPNPDRSHPFAKAYRDAARHSFPTVAPPDPSELDGAVGVAVVDEVPIDFVDRLAVCLARGMSHLVIGCAAGNKAARRELRKWTPSGVVTLVDADDLQEVRVKAEAGKISKGRRLVVVDLDAPGSFTQSARAVRDLLLAGEPKR